MVAVWCCAKTCNEKSLCAGYCSEFFRCISHLILRHSRRQTDTVPMLEVRKQRAWVISQGPKWQSQDTKLGGLIQSPHSSLTASPQHGLACPHPSPSPLLVSTSHLAFCRAVSLQSRWGGHKVQVLACQSPEHKGQSPFLQCSPFHPRPLACLLCAVPHAGIPDALFLLLLWVSAYAIPLFGQLLTISP